MSLAAEFAARLRRALGVLKTDLPVVKAFPILREIEPLREAAFGPRSWPGILIKSLPSGKWHLATSVPDVDYVHQAELPERMNDAESDEVRRHLIAVVENWLNWAEVQRVIPDPAEMVVESLRWFLSLSPFELVQRAAGVGRFDLLPLFKLCHPRGAYLENRGGMAELVPGPSAIDEVAESLLAGPMSAMGSEVARRWLDLSAGIKSWRDEVRDRKRQWEYDHLCELCPAVDLRAVFGDELIEQAERLRMDAGALVRLIERARVTADPKPVDLRDVAPQELIQDKAIANPKPDDLPDPGDGLFPDAKCFIWGGRRFERLTVKMVNVLTVFTDQFRSGFPIVNLQTIQSKINTRFDGAFISQAFKQNRKGEPPIHPVAAVIEIVGRGEYRLIDPQKIKI
ncbi:MAG: hypothetical protein JNK57_02860 [Planctomycetaceae bacterium]|nr:hypothetical protein [Planctomycetaceae bacterium]